MTYDVESPGPGMAQAQTCGGANSVNGGTNSPHLDNWTSNDNKQTMNKNTLIRFHSKNLLEVSVVIFCQKSNVF
jgi:hypothetical protein